MQVDLTIFDQIQWEGHGKRTCEVDFRVRSLEIWGQTFETWGFLLGFPQSNNGCCTFECIGFLGGKHISGVSKLFFAFPQWYSQKSAMAVAVSRQLVCSCLFLHRCIAILIRYLCTYVYIYIYIIVFFKNNSYISLVNFSNCSQRYSRNDAEAMQRESLGGDLAPGLGGPADRRRRGILGIS